MGLHLKGSMTPTLSAPLLANISDPSVTLSARVTYDTRTQTLSVYAGDLGTPILSYLLDLCNVLDMKPDVANLQLYLGFSAGINSTGGAGVAVAFVSKVDASASEFLGHSNMPFLLSITLKSILCRSVLNFLAKRTILKNPRLDTTQG